MSDPPMCLPRRAHRDHIHSVAPRYGIPYIRMLRSVGHDSAAHTSALGLLVDLGAGYGYLELTGFGRDIEDLLAGYIQLSTVNGLTPRARDHVLDAAVTL